MENIVTITLPADTARNLMLLLEDVCVSHATTLPMPVVREVRWEVECELIANGYQPLPLRLGLDH